MKVTIYFKVENLAFMKRENCKMNGFICFLTKEREGKKKLYKDDSIFLSFLANCTFLISFSLFHAE